jgi:sarcosine oxidase, subunit alpha
MTPAARLRTMDARARVTIWRNGRAVAAHEGEAATSALWAKGRRVLSRSMRYHRARGLFCGTGECTSCFMRVDGVPNVRACQVACREGLWLEDQNAWPSAQRDVLAAADLAFPGYLDAHSSFIRPTFLKPVFTRVIRGMAGFGRIPRQPVEQRFDHRVLETDVLVVGAGPAGLMAAEEAAQAGRRVLMLEREARLGGRVAWMRDAEASSWLEARRDVLESLGVEVLARTRLLGVYEDAALVAASPTALISLKASSVVLATGSRDAYLPFAGSDRAGVMLASAAHRMLAEDGVVCGRRPIIVGATAQGLSLAADLEAAGVEVDAVYDAAAEGQASRRVLWDHRPVRALGRRRLKKVEFATTTGGHRVEGDVLVLAQARAARSELAQQAGCALEWRPGSGFVAVADASGSTGVKGVWAAGSMAGSRDWKESAAMGQRAGRSAA